MNLKDSVEEKIKVWQADEKEKAQYLAVKKVFELFPKNDNLVEVLIKVSVIDDFYATNLYGTYTMAKHIVDLKIDEKLSKNDLSVVSDIANIRVKDKVRNNYSFATKYCSHHNEEFYPIYDQYVDKSLCFFRKKDNFCDFKNDDLKKYEKFKSVIQEFSEKYELTDYSVRDIDKFLWLFGKGGCK